MFQGQEMCGPDVWKDQAEFTAVSAIRKRMFCAERVTSAVPMAGNALFEKGVLRFLYLQGFKMTHGRACQFSGRGEAKQTVIS